MEGAALANCPFCSGDVSETLILHGGTCPHCFGDVPGEETPTDPGEEIKTQLAEESLRHARRRTLMPVFLATPVVLGFLMFAGYQALNVPEYEVIELPDDVLADFTIEIVAYDPENDPELAEEKADAVAGRPAGKPSRSALEKALAEKKPGLVASGGSASDQLGGSDVAYQPGSKRPSARSAGVRDIGSMPSGPGGVSTSKPAASGVGVDISFNAERIGGTLETEEDIRAAVLAMWGTRIPTLRRCYEARLKLNEDLGGQWKVAMTIRRDGTLEDVRATGVDMADAELEACMVARVSGWKLSGQLPKPRSITLPVGFKKN